MARRRIGQEDLIARPEAQAVTALTDIAALPDWAGIDRALVYISAAAKGEPGWPPRALFRALPLATWHELSNVRLAEALDVRLTVQWFATAVLLPSPLKCLKAINQFAVNSGYGVSAPIAGHSRVLLMLRN